MLLLMLQLLQLLQLSLLLKVTKQEAAAARAATLTDQPGNRYRASMLHAAVCGCLRLSATLSHPWTDTGGQETRGDTAPPDVALLNTFIAKINSQM
jgi:hypothetical protein